MGLRLVVEEVGVVRVRIGEENSLKLLVFKNALDSIRLRNSCLANTFKFRMCHFDGYEREEKKEDEEERIKAARSRSCLSRDHM